ncbi:MAG: hypothetical protein HXY43_20080 [Fischerella sp.]|jgi:hypothetical protein|uniref:hypothetical protein n=1 Tax=Fischerella sp. TaxID=1191 RepID=UPI00183AF62C|nr:hypothetical protein [Fischerella sp.]NWF61480.1 hypothetical protein [Fischerella sp.]
MKLLLLALIVMIGALGVTPNASADQTNVRPAKESGNQKAASLITQPVTINGNWVNVINRNHHLQQTSGSISVVREQGCQKIDPLELINNLGRILEECEKQKNNPTPQHTQIEYFQTPKQLDSGINVTVTQF